MCVYVDDDVHRGANNFDLIGSFGIKWLTICAVDHSRLRYSGGEEHLAHLTVCPTSAMALPLYQYEKGVV